MRTIATACAITNVVYGFMLVALAGSSATLTALGILLIAAGAVLIVVVLFGIASKSKR